MDNPLRYERRDCRFESYQVHQIMPELRAKVLVRRNLKMSPQKMSAQVGHAIDAAKEYLSMPFGASIIVLMVSDAKFEEAKKSHTVVVIKDAGYTEVTPGSETCLAFLEDDPRHNVKAEDAPALD